MAKIVMGPEVSMESTWEGLVRLTLKEFARGTVHEALVRGAMRELRNKYGARVYPDVVCKIEEAAVAWDKHEGRKEPFCKLLFRSLTTRSKRPWVAPMREALLLLMQHKLMGDE